VSASGSMRVVVLALLANLGIALSKLVAAIVTGSGAMLAEAVHSFADAGNQGLLLVGHARASRPPDSRHPLGYRRETYFWALLVAALLFVLGGAFSLYEGVHKLTDPHPLSHVGWAIGILLVGVVLEGFSLRAAWKECRAARGDAGLLAWSRQTGDVNLLVVVFEDIAAMAGLVFALLAVALSAVTGDPLFDALGSCVIGVLLLVVAVFIASQVRRLIIGLSASEDLRAGIRAVWEEEGFEVLKLLAIWDGPSDVLVACKVRPFDRGQDAATLMRRINEVEARITVKWPAVDVQFIEPDTTA
jgi:cation diffusion facilitator family transporter